MGNWTTTSTMRIPEFSAPNFSSPVGETGEASAVYTGESVVAQMADYDMVMGYIDAVEAHLAESGIEIWSLSNEAILALCMKFAYAANDPEVQYLAEHGLDTAEKFGAFRDFDVVGAIESSAHAAELIVMLDEENARQKERQKEIEKAERKKQAIAKIKNSINIYILKVMLSSEKDPEVKAAIIERLAFLQMMGTTVKPQSAVVFIEEERVSATR